MKKINPPEAILFDMDGVLVDVSESYRMAIKKTAEFFLGIEISLAEIQTYKNKGGNNNDWDLTEAIINNHGKIVEMDEIIARFQMLYLGKDFNGFIKNEKWLLDKNVMYELKKSCKLGIVTGRPRREAEYALHRFDSDSQFSVIITLEDTPVSKRKPHPYGIKLAMDRLSAKRAVYIGDTVDDIKAAVSAGITPIGVINTKNNVDTVQSFKQHGAQFIFKNVNEILEILA